MKARFLIVALSLFLTVYSDQICAGEFAALAEEIIKTTGVKGGFVVHLGCGNGELTAALHRTAGYQVQGLDRNPAKVAAARAYIQKLDRYGDVCVDRLEGNLLPYIDNLVNLLVAENLDGVSLDEVKRVLVPNGVAYIKQGGVWEKIVKPRPDTLDEWTHYFYSAKGNAVSHDTAVGPPERLQWLGSPRWSRHHDRISSLSAMVSAGGRVFSILDEGSRISILLPSHWSLIARDAFNGTILWKQPIEKWQTQMWPLKSGPTQLTRRLVADGDNVYVTTSIDGAVKCLDGATGALRREYAGTKGAEEIIHVNGVLYLLVNPADWVLEDFAPKFNTGDQKRVETEFNWDKKARELQAINAGTGALIWKKTAVVAPLTLASDGKHVVYYDGEKVINLDPKTGEQRWASPPEEKRKLFEFNYGPRVVLDGEVVLYAGGGGTMKGISAETGKELWTSPHSRSGYRSPEDLLVAGGLVWNAPTTAGGMSGTFTGRNPVSGEVKSEFSPDINTYWFHHRCYIAKGTDKYLLTSRTGIEFVDINAKHWDINHWVRSSCLYGVMPANGLVIAGPHDCACYPETKLYGFNALAPALTTPLPAPLTDEQRLERGPAYAEVVSEVAADTKDWPVYRHDNARSGYTNQPLLEDHSKAWEVTLGGKLSAPVAAAGMLLVSQVDKHLLHALDAENGKSLWQFTAGGRIDSPPAYWKGRVLFGSMDGSVYCLRAKDGALIWRYHASPLDRRHMAFEQLESVWPVHGSVLVENGSVSFVAGRSVFLDGGLRFTRLDAATGKKLAEVVYDDKDPDTGKDLQTRVKILQMPVGLNDILSSDGKHIFLRSQKIEFDGKRIEIGPVSGDAAQQGAAQHGEGAHIFAPMGYLDDSWFHRSYWVFGRNFAGGHSGYYQAGKYTPTGRLLVFDDKDVYSYGRQPQYFKWTTTMEYQLFSASKEAPESRQASGGGKAGKAVGKVVSEAEITDAHVRLPDSEKLDPSHKEITLEAWVYPDDHTGVIASFGSSAQGFALTLQDGEAAFSIRATKELYMAVAPKALSDGWHHLAGVLSKEHKLKLYVDGKLAHETKAPNLIPSKPKVGFTLGYAAGQVTEHGRGTPYTGLLDQFALFFRALSEAEIADHAAMKTNPVKADAGAVVAYAFDNGDARDVSGNQLHGVVTGVETGQGKLGGALLFKGKASLHPNDVKDPKVAEAKDPTEPDAKDIKATNDGKPKADKPVAAQDKKLDLVPAKNRDSAVQSKWSRPAPIFAKGMVLAGDTLIYAGPPDTVDEEYAFERLKNRDKAIQNDLADQDAALDDKKGARILFITKGGDGLGTDVDLESSPVWDGMIVAQGRIYISTLSGKLVCLGKAK